jgi:hypothetical protein
VRLAHAAGGNSSVNQYCGQLISMIIDLHEPSVLAIQSSPFTFYPMARKAEHRGLA